MKKFTCFCYCFIAFSIIGFAQTKLPKVLLRVDDIGMNHAVNMAIQQLAESGIPLSASVMFVCPWYQETVDILKKNPQITVGVHLTLNAEWRYYRWGPVLGKSAVPSLVDSLGYFLPSVEAFTKSNYKLDEVEKELDAQISRAINSGLKITYVDPHMGTVFLTLELRAIVEKLAKKYSLGISGYFQESYRSMWGVPVENKKQDFINFLTTAPVDSVTTFELHIAQSAPEMEVLMDMNSTVMGSDSGKPNASKHRQTELNMLLSAEFRELIGKKIQLVTYADVVKTAGLNNMKRPVQRVTTFNTPQAK
jgi:chitin disaccharide deacetylase